MIEIELFGYKKHLPELRQRKAKLEEELKEVDAAIVEYERQKEVCDNNRNFA